MCSTGVNVILLTPVRSLWPSLRRLSEIRNDQQRYVHISSTEFHSNKKKKVKNADTNSFTSLNEVWF